MTRLIRRNTDLIFDVLLVVCIVVRSVALIFLILVYQLSGCGP